MCKFLERKLQEVGRVSKPREIWWSYAKAMIRQYPHITASAGAYKRLSEVKQKEVLAVKEALLITRTLPNAATRVEIIKLVLWQSGCTLDQAAARLYISESTAYRYHRDFVLLVGKCYGLTK